MGKEEDVKYWMLAAFYPTLQYSTTPVQLLHHSSHK